MLHDRSAVQVRKMHADQKRQERREAPATREIGDPRSRHDAAAMSMLPNLCCVAFHFLCFLRWLRCIGSER